MSDNRKSPEERRKAIAARQLWGGGYAPVRQAQKDAAAAVRVAIYRLEEQIATMKKQLERMENVDE